MVSKTNRNFKKNITNFFGSLGYFFVTLQWLWSIMLYFSLIENLTKFMSPNIDTEKVTQVTPIADSSINIPVMIIAGIITAIILIITIYALIKTPSTVVKTSRTVVRETVEAVTPMVMRAQHHDIEDKVSSRRIKSHLTMILKILLVVIPIVLALTSKFLEVQKIDYLIAVYASLWLASFSIVFFLIQYILARFLSVNNKELR